MKMIVDSRGQRLVNTPHRYQIVDAGPLDALQASEFPEQRFPAGWSQPGNGFEHRHVLCFAAPLAMTGDRESMGFVANLLNQV